MWCNLVELQLTDRSAQQYILNASMYTLLQHIPLSHECCLLATPRDHVM